MSVGWAQTCDFNLNHDLWIASDKLSGAISHANCFLTLDFLKDFRRPRILNEAPPCVVYTYVIFPEFSSTIKRNFRPTYFSYGENTLKLVSARLWKLKLSRLWRRKGDKTKTFWQEHAQLLESRSGEGDKSLRGKLLSKFFNPSKKLSSHSTPTTWTIRILGSSLQWNISATTQSFSIVTRKKTKLLIRLSILIRSIYYRRSFVDNEKTGKEKFKKQSEGASNKENKMTKKLLTGEVFVQKKRRWNQARKWSNGKCEGKNNEWESVGVPHSSFGVIKSRVRNWKFIYEQTTTSEASAARSKRNLILIFD